MLGTFSFEIYFKSYPCFTFRSLEILEISKRPFSPSSSPSALSRRRVQCSAARRRRGEPARPLLLRAGAHASRGSSSTRWSLPGRATRPRRAQSRPRGRHCDAAVESPLQSSPSFPIARTGTTKTPASYSSPPFAFSVLPRPRTAPPPRLNSDELTSAAEPPPQTRSTPIAPTISRASS